MLKRACSSLNVMDEALEKVGIFKTVLTLKKKWKTFLSFNHRWIGKGYLIRIEVYERAITEPNLRPGDIRKIQSFILHNVNNDEAIAVSQNEHVRKTFGKDMMSQMAFDLIPAPLYASMCQLDAQDKWTIKSDPKLFDLNAQNDRHQLEYDHSVGFFENMSNAKAAIAEDDDNLNVMSKRVINCKKKKKEQQDMSFQCSIHFFLYNTSQISQIAFPCLRLFQFFSVKKTITINKFELNS
ncbi:hypothetical protein RFI_18352 [Reticulomyxa filosa]|uniref:Uncharacterized protein n=1 Tax=Reticulomyxa filosa TaxID=46433 RepID=X6MZK5_RETFI|nr:hypothetical protein RFI_18352 [Reticulomyxa filosa]|eukprot:ETO18894.1 hypothetical protein RFI_18352 [Reticulomyxa filosa]